MKEKLAGSDFRPRHRTIKSAASSTRIAAIRPQTLQGFQAKTKCC
jgi:hypothetical protein